ncbi:hypothetical protein IC582_027100 [Cucumis melo]
MVAVKRIFRLEHGLLRFMRALHLLTTIGEERAAHLEFYSSGLKFVVVSHHLCVILHIRPPLLLHYYQPPNSSKYLNIHLKEFCDLLRDKICTSSWMDFNLDHRQPPLATLTFGHDDCGEDFTGSIRVSNSKDEGDFGDITSTKFVSIDSKQFKRIVMEFINIDKVDVVLTNSQLTFSCEFNKEITLNVEDKECIIGGVNSEERVEYSIKFRPTKFFSDLTSMIERVWFYHNTTKTNIVISAPIAFEALFIITFMN